MLYGGAEITTLTIRISAAMSVLRALVVGRVITSARGTVIAAEVAVKNMYHEEPELLPAASGTNTEKGAPPTIGGDEEPVWSWEQPVWPAEVAAEVAEVVAAIRQAKTVTFLYCGSLKFTSEIKKMTYIGDYNLETS